MKKLFATLAFIIGAVGIVYYSKNDISPKFSSSPSSGEAAFASTSNRQQEIIDEMTKKILAVSNKSQINATAAAIIKMAEEIDPQGIMPGVQLIAGYMKIVTGLEGIIYRFRPIIEPSDWLHMSALNMIRLIRYNSYLYGRHALAFLDYITAPSERLGPQFNTITEAQQYLMEKAAPLLEALTAQAITMESLQADKFDFKIDRRLFVGEGDNIRFIDESETLKRFMKPNLYSVIFSLQRVMSSMYYFAALNVDDLPSVTSEIVAATTINQLKGKLRDIVSADHAAKGLTPMLTFGVLSKHPNYFTFRELKLKIDGQDKVYSAQYLLNKAYAAIHRASYYELASFNCIIHGAVTGKVNLPAAECLKLSFPTYNGLHVDRGEEFLYNPNQLLIDFKAKSASLIQRYNLYNESKTIDITKVDHFDAGKFATLESEVTGKTIRLNIRALFNAKNSPRLFFPTSFKKEREASYNVGKTFGWHYDHGYPTSYGKDRNDFTFGGFFDGNEVKNLGALEEAMATLVYTRSTSTFSAFLPFPGPVQFPIPLPDSIILN